jgi:hypothetical protein
MSFPQNPFFRSWLESAEAGTERPKFFAENHDEKDSRQW